MQGEHSPLNNIGAGIEICANSYASAKEAQKGGAIRVELCENMAEGGTTPSYAQILLCKKNLNLQVWPIIRPRGGDFLYSDDEFEIMKQYSKLTMGWCVDCHRKTDVKMEGNAYYDKIHAELSKKYGVEKLTAAQMGGLECGKCHY